MVDAEAVLGSRLTAHAVEPGHRLDLEHFRAEVGKDPPSERAGDHPGHVDHPDPLERLQRHRFVARRMRRLLVGRSGRFSRAEPRGRQNRQRRLEGIERAAAVAERLAQLGRLQLGELPRVLIVLGFGELVEAERRHRGVLAGLQPAQHVFAVHPRGELAGQHLHGVVEVPPGGARGRQLGPSRRRRCSRARRRPRRASPGSAAATAGRRCSPAICRRGTGAPGSAPGEPGISRCRSQVLGFEVCTNASEVASCIEMSICAPGCEGTRSRPCSATIAALAMCRPVMVCAT